MFYMRDFLCCSLGRRNIILFRTGNLKNLLLRHFLAADPRQAGNGGDIQLRFRKDQPLARLFGLELYDLTHADVTYDAENDFHGIYYLCGGAGLVLMLAFVGYFLFRVVRALVLDFKGVFTFSAAGFGIAMICGLAHAYFTAGVLRRPNSNFYLGVIFAVIYILSERTVRKTEENEK